MTLATQGFVIRAPKPPFIISKFEDQKSIIFSIFSKSIKKKIVKIFSIFKFLKFD